MSRESDIIKQFTKEFCLKFIMQVQNLAADYSKTQQPETEKAATSNHANRRTTDILTYLQWLKSRDSSIVLLQFALELCQSYEQQIFIITNAGVDCLDVADFVAHQIVDSILEDDTDIVGCEFSGKSSPVPEINVEFFFKIFQNDKFNGEIIKDDGLVFLTTRNLHNAFYFSGIIQTKHEGSRRHLVRTSNIFLTFPNYQYRLELKHENIQSLVSSGDFRFVEKVDIPENVLSYEYHLSDAELEGIKRDILKILENELTAAEAVVLSNSEASYCKVKQFKKTMEIDAQNELTHTNKVMEQITSLSERMANLKKDFQAKPSEDRNNKEEQNTRELISNPTVHPGLKSNYLRFEIKKLSK